MPAAWVAIDTETDGLDSMAPIWSASAWRSPGRPATSRSVTWRRRHVRRVPVQLPLAEVARCLRPLLEDEGVLKIGHNIKYDINV
jgi:DNA polymerase-1